MIERYPRITFSNAAKEKVAEIEELFAQLERGERTEVEDQPKVLEEMKRDLHSNLAYLNDYRDDWTVELCADFVPCSFRVAWLCDGKVKMQGGLIFQGSGQETFSVHIGTPKWWTLNT
jgi:hypothetical protein